MNGLAVSVHAPSAGSSAIVSAFTDAGTRPRAVAENGPHAAAIRKAAAGFAAASKARLCRIPQGANALGLARHGVLPASRDAILISTAPSAPR